jgi:predicted site-specific integrase-resolvase
MGCKFFKPSDLAERYGLSVRTLANWRHRGEGPKFVKINGRVRYLESDVKAYERGAKK